MKKQPQNRATPYRVSPIDAQRFRGSILTVFGNLAALLIYVVILRFSVDETLGLMVFAVLALLQLIVCAVIGFNYNSKMWLISALIIFLIGCIAVVYETI